MEDIDHLRTGIIPSNKFERWLGKNNAPRRLWFSDRRKQWNFRGHGLGKPELQNGVDEGGSVIGRRALSISW